MAGWNLEWIEQKSEWVNIYTSIVHIWRSQACYKGLSVSFAAWDHLAAGVSGAVKLSRLGLSGHVPYGGATSYLEAGEAPFSSLLKVTILSSGYPDSSHTMLDLQEGEASQYPIQFIPVTLLCLISFPCALNFYLVVWKNGSTSLSCLELSWSLLLTWTNKYMNK